jgi:ribonuclease HI
MFQKNNITIYTDGSSRGNPGPGGFASIVVINDERVIELGGHDKHTTNNKMELMGVIEGLKVSLTHIDSNIKNINIYSDSKYVLQGITTWIHNWKKNNWRTAAKKEVLNQELWQELDKTVEAVSQKKVNIEWHYVKGHADNLYNNRADIIATTSADIGETKILFDGSFIEWHKRFD